MRALLTNRNVRHLTTEPYRPQTNGKVERFHQTMEREWGYGWLRHYNEHRPHSSIGDLPPINRVHNLHRQDN